MASTPTIEEQNNVKDRWDSIKHYKEAIELNRMFIRGEMLSTPYHLGPLDEESDSLREGLLRLHDYGLLTTGSQPHQVHPQGIQRSFLTFMIPTNEEVRKLCKFLIRNTTIDVCIRSQIASVAMNRWPAPQKKWGASQKALGYDFTSGEVNIKPTTSVLQVEEGFEELWTEFLPRVVEMRPLEITIIAKDWNYTGLLSVILEKAIIKAGMKNGWYL